MRILLIVGFMSIKYMTFIGNVNILIDVFGEGAIFFCQDGL
jgi:hypothetical protein